MRSNPQRWLRPTHLITVLILVFGLILGGVQGVYGNHASAAAQSNVVASTVDELTPTVTTECACTAECAPTPTATPSPTDVTVTVEPSVTPTDPVETITAEPTDSTVTATSIASPTPTDPVETNTAEPTDEATAIASPTDPAVTPTDPVETNTAEPTDPAVTATSIASPTPTAIVTATATVSATAEPSVTAEPSATDGTIATAIGGDTPGDGRLTSAFAAPARSGLTTTVRAAAQANAIVIPGCRVELVDFTDNIDVVQDRDGAAAQKIDEYTDACARKDTIEWKVCVDDKGAIKGTKNWPVAYVQDTSIKIVKADFVLPPAVKLQGDVEVTGSASADNQPLTFSGKGTQDGNGKVSVANLTSTGKLPKHITAFKNLRITWLLKGKDKDGKDRGPFELSSSHPIYVLLARPIAPPKPRGAAAVPVYLTLVDISTERAKGKSKRDEVVEAVWNEFKTKRVSRRDLNPETGEITVGAALLYYNKDWTLAKELDKTYSRNSPEDLVGLLKDKVSICSAWAYFLADMLRMHGIAADVNAVRPEKGLKATDRDGKLLDPITEDLELPASKDAKNMLVKTWTFKNPGAGAFPYKGADWAHDPTKAAPGQNNPQPPGFFSNHIIVYYRDEQARLRIYDPSYGEGPFANLDAWTLASLSGYVDEAGTAACKLSSNKGKPVCGR